MYCEHNRLAASCEDCAYIAALNRGEPTARVAAAATDTRDRAPVNVGPEQDGQVVDTDTRVMRPDLDADLGTKGAYTFVRAGDEVPADLADKPRKAGPLPGMEHDTKARRAK